MKSLFAVLAFVFAWGLSAPAAARSDPALMAEMQRVEESRNAAIRASDFAVLERLYAEEFQGVAGNGRTVTRDDLFAVFRRAGGAFGPVDSRVLSVQRDGDFAFVLGRIAIQPQGGGEPAVSVFLHVFKRVTGEWRMISGSATPAAAS